MHSSSSCFNVIFNPKHFTILKGRESKAKETNEDKFTKETKEEKEKVFENQKS